MTHKFDQQKIVRNYDHLGKLKKKKTTFKKAVNFSNINNESLNNLNIITP